jgi:multicomponent Na+:H+ antiporter subunit B
MVDLLLLLLLVIFSFYAVYEQDLLSSIIVLSAFSLIMTIVWTRLNAVDVAFTEASVGAGVSTIIFLAALSRTKRREENNRKKDTNLIVYNLIAFLIVVLTGSVLIYGTFDMPDFGDYDAPVNNTLAPRYIYGSMAELGIKNFVTSILAAYRGYDTLGETTVIFTAGVAVVILLRRKELS